MRLGETNGVTLSRRSIGQITEAQRIPHLKIHRVVNSFLKTRYRLLSTISPSSVLHDKYMELVKARDVEADPHQLKALKALERLRNQLIQGPPPPPPVEGKSPTESLKANAASKSSSSFPSLSGWISSSSSSLTTSRQSAKLTKGVYLHGGVGCGKTFLMNLFYDSLDGITELENNRQKVHFHKFMLQVHQEMHIARYNSDLEGSQAQKKRNSDSILPFVIEKTLQKGRILCFDEFQGMDF